MVYVSLWCPCTQGLRHCVLQGELEITTEAGTGKAAVPNAQGEVTDLVERVPFLMLALDLPPAPLYKDALEKNIIPQVHAQPSTSPWHS